MVALILLFGMTLAYQAEMPCDDACFGKKIQQEAGTYEDKRGENDWRYERYSHRN